MAFSSARSSRRAVASGTLKLTAPTHLGPDRDDVSAVLQPWDSLAAVSPQSRMIIDAYLEWVDRNRSVDTYEWYVTDCSDSLSGT